MKKCPNLIILGATAFDDKKFYDGKHRLDVGGACMYSAIPASVFHPVGIVTKIGSDFPLDKIRGFNIDLTGLKIIEEKTTIFYSKFLSEDGKQREITGDLSEKMKLSFHDIPKAYMETNFFHITTMEPMDALELITQLRKQTSAKISVDTIGILATNPLTEQVFDLVDIAFIDREYTNLLDCKAPVKVIKLGKEGCIYKNDSEEFKIQATIKQKSRR